MQQARSGDRRALAQAITALELGTADAKLKMEIKSAAARRKVPVLGVTGTGGAGKSSLTDELVRRFRLDQDEKLRVAVIAVDPSRARPAGRCSAIASG
jgi:methylmalonyl-CoA mutase